MGCGCRRGVTHTDEGGLGPEADRAEGASEGVEGAKASFPHPHCQRPALAARPRTRPGTPQWLEAQKPRYKTDASGALVPDVRAAAAIIYNPENGQVLWEANSQDKRSIASITKVMTAAVVLEDDPDLSRVVVVDRARHIRRQPHLSAAEGSRHASATCCTSR